MPDHGSSIVDPDAPVTAAERERFNLLQNHFARSFSKIFDDPKAPRAVLTIPSLSLDQQVMARITGVHHYEERMLCLLLLLRMPRTRMIYVPARLSTRQLSTIICTCFPEFRAGMPASVSRFCLATTPRQSRSPERLCPATCS